MLKRSRPDLSIPPICILVHQAAERSQRRLKFAKNLCVYPDINRHPITQHMAVYSLAWPSPTVPLWEKWKILSFWQSHRNRSRKICLFSGIFALFPAYTSEGLAKLVRQALEPSQQTSHTPEKLNFWRFHSVVSAVFCSAEIRKRTERSETVPLRCFGGMSSNVEWQ